ncbi:MAG: hypothetical protein ACOY7J_02250 [Pseudomonadota bacterium]
MNKILTGALLLAAFGPCAFADNAAPLATPSNDFGALIGGAFTVGGDELAEYRVEYEDGDDGSENIRAGEQFYLFGGAYFRHTESAELAYGAQFNVGWFNNSISGDNGDVTLTRYPFELIPFIEFHQFRFGLGLTQHTSTPASNSMMTRYWKPAWKQTTRRAQSSWWNTCLVTTWRWACGWWILNMNSARVVIQRRLMRGMRGLVWRICSERKTTRSSVTCTGSPMAARCI